MPFLSASERGALNLAAIRAGFSHVARAGTVPGTGQNQPSARPPVLAREEAARRAALLCDLQSAIAALGVSSVLARRHRLVLEGGSTKAAPSGLTDPQLHVFTSGGTSIVTTSGLAYMLHGHAYPVDDPAQAADALRRVPDSEVR